MKRLCSGPDGDLGGQGAEDKVLCLDWKLQRRGSQGSVADRLRGGDKDGWSAGVDGGGHTGGDVGAVPWAAPAQVDAG